MPSVFWTGNLSFLTRMMANASNALAWITGNARDTASMKHRIRLGYEGGCSTDLARYDELGEEHYTRIAQELLAGVDIRGRRVLDVGCGTGILSSRALEQGAASLVCGDTSEYMLDQCRKRMVDQGYEERVELQHLDAEALPFGDCSFDAVVSGMVLGLVPNQQMAVREMVRVLDDGGALALSTHGPEHYREAIEATLRASSKRYVFGYRIEFWPRSEVEVHRILAQNGLSDVQIRRTTWQDSFRDGGEAFDFFAATSACWWYARIPPERRQEESIRLRSYFAEHGVRRITQDVILARGAKP
jgi:ubiquinone/menaquinone biosynthesis C-methylase UbiE